MQGGNDTSILLGGSKGSMGAQQECCGHLQILKAVWSTRYASIPATIHLRTLNGHIEVEDRPVVVHTEHLSYRCRAAYHATATRSIAGSNVNLLFWGKASEKNAAVVGGVPTFQKEVFYFWPGGGGAIADRATYCIYGSWSNWQEAQTMVDDGRGNFCFEVTMGEACSESFQILLDGDPGRALHPGVASGSNGGVVAGPDSSEISGYWTIGRGMGAQGSQDLALHGAAGNRDKASPGDKILVRFSVAGKWRTVTWFKTN